MVHPKLKTLAQLATRGTNIDIDTALADLESKTIEYLQHHYLMGEIAYPLHYLFGQPHGVMRHYANNYARSTKRFDEVHELYAEAGDIEEEEAAYNPTADEEPTTEATRIARAVINDGITLSLLEYRVLSFCMQNAADAKRPINGLHVYLARVLGIPRAKTTKIYSDAIEKVKRELNE